MVDVRLFIEYIHTQLLPQLVVESTHPHDPIVVRHIPEPWKLMGAGNYAVVVSHPDFADRVVKIYAPGRHGWEEEVEVYRRLGQHPAYAECFHSDKDHRYLVLRRLYGVTLYDCFRRGIPIPEQVIFDIDEALDYARNRGLRPHDVHGKNVMLNAKGRGLVVDVSDFLKHEPCRMWHDLKKAYYKIYLPYLYDKQIPIPDVLLNVVRKAYRIVRRIRSMFHRSHHVH
ncbi:serine/threonine protein kinase [Paenibacillus chartarius]|uniref:Serine/threonine protein kinase n=1 Tax=Paenibacillus chartarius TaxID=747481 RepID=A0ABV6DE75_9BACL